MDHLALFAFRGEMLCYALPMILTISLVYAATRHERPVPILLHAARVALWITGVLAAIIGVIWAIMLRL